MNRTIISIFVVLALSTLVITQEVVLSENILVLQETNTDVPVTTTEEPATTTTDAPATTTTTDAPATNPTTTTTDDAVAAAIKEGTKAAEQVIDSLTGNTPAQVPA